MTTLHIKNTQDYLEIASSGVSLVLKSDSPITYSINVAPHTSVTIGIDDQTQSTHQSNVVQGSKDQKTKAKSLESKASFEGSKAAPTKQLSEVLHELLNSQPIQAQQPESSVDLITLADTLPTIQKQAIVDNPSLVISNRIANIVKRSSFGEKKVLRNLAQPKSRKQIFTMVTGLKYDDASYQTRGNLMAKYIWKYVKLGLIHSLDTTQKNKRDIKFQLTTLGTHVVSQFITNQVQA